MFRSTGRRRGKAYLHIIPLLLVVVIGFALRLAPIDQNRFHEDEALYAYWGLQIATGADPMLDRQPVDKPPLFPYLVALSFLAFGPSEVAARLPSLVASTLTLLAVGLIGWRVYGYGAGLAAMTVLAVNPFDISLAATAFTDPLLVAWVILALGMAAARRPIGMGLSLGLALATKQQALLFVPLIVAAGMVAWQVPRRARQRVSAAPVSGKFLRQARQAIRQAWTIPLVRGSVAFGLAFACTIGWDIARLQRPGFFEQSLISYGGLGMAAPGTWCERGVDWLALLGKIFGSPFVNAVLLIGIGALAVADMVILRRREVGLQTRPTSSGITETGLGLPPPSGERERRGAWLDLLLLAFVIGFVLLHWLTTFNAWDRYLLGLVPLIALLTGRATMLPVRLVAGRPRWRYVALASPMVGALLLIGGMRGVTAQAVAGHYPAGGDHGAYQGIDALAHYIESEVPPSAVIHHRWLGWHYSYYLFGLPQALRWYPSPVELVAQALEWPDVPHYVAFPEWRERSDAEAALAGAGLGLMERYQALRSDGSVSFRMFEILPLDIIARNDAPADVLSQVESR